MRNYSMLNNIVTVFDNVSIYRLFSLLTFKLDHHFTSLFFQINSL